MFGSWLLEAKVTVKAQLLSEGLLSRKLGRNTILPGPFPVVSQNITEDGDVELKIVFGGDLMTVPLTFDEYLTLEEDDVPQPALKYSEVWGDE